MWINQESEIIVVYTKNSSEIKYEILVFQRGKAPLMNFPPIRFDFWWPIKAINECHSYDTLSLRNNLLNTKYQYELIKGFKVYLRQIYDI